MNRVDDLGVAATRPSHVITVYGADHPGIVHAVSAALAERGVNITGLETRLAGAADSPLYVMIIEVAMPEASEPDLEAALSEVARPGRGRGEPAPARGGGALDERPVAAREVLVYPHPMLKQVAAPAQAGDAEADRTRPARHDAIVRALRRAGRPADRGARTGGRGRRAGTPEGRHATTACWCWSIRGSSRREGSEVAREGCLSIPDLTANVRRATSIVVEHAEGAVHCLGFEARCVQHELDHLDGILFLDRVESLVDDVFRRRVYADKPDSQSAELSRPARARRRSLAPGDRAELEGLRRGTDRVVVAVAGGERSRHAVADVQHQVEHRRGQADQRLDSIAPDALLRRLVHCAPLSALVEEEARAARPRSLPGSSAARPRGCRSGPRCRRGSRSRPARRRRRPAAAGSCAGPSAPRPPRGPCPARR